MNEYSESKAKDFTCDYCGKNRKYGKCLKVSWDVGYSWEDCDSQYICWKCEIKEAMHKYSNRIKAIKIYPGKSVTGIITYKHIYMIHWKKLEIHKLKKA